MAMFAFRRDRNPRLNCDSDGEGFTQYRLIVYKQVQRGSK